MGYITASSIKEAKKQAKRYNRTHTTKKYVVSSVRKASKTKTYSGGMKEKLYTVRLKK